MYLITSLGEEVQNGTPQIVFDFTTAGVQILSLFIGVVLPLLVGLVTRVTTSAGTKATLLAVLSAVTGLLTELLAATQANTSYDLAQGVLTAIATFLVGVGLHYGLWKPTGVSAKLQDVNVGV